ncbi:MAG: selenocysteine-specific translation elongation factor, partial [Chloroflexi bacterium]
MRVIGTAGHVDHGKSTLVKRLTGIDPDRLAEEKAREMTIELGFAWLTLPDGEEVGIVDVPGHRDFIENMLAGVGSIDAVLLVIAADEGVMPQTREHLAILDLLGVKRGLVVLTKIDLIDDEAWLELVTQDVRDVLQGTTLAQAPILPVSAHSGEGVEALLTALTALLQETPRRANYNRPYLSIDRVFTISGFGTVVTGTLLGGALSVGDEVMIYPQQLGGRIRGLQSHKKKVERAVPGSRVAVNIAGVEKRQIARGDLLAYPEQLKPTLLADVHFRYLPDAQRPLKHNAEVKFFSEATERVGRVRLLDSDMLSPGESGWLQIRFEQPTPLIQGERFILRYPSPPQTIGGGVIVNPNPGKRWKRHQPQVIAALETRLSGRPADKVAQAADTVEPIKISQLQQITGYDEEDLAIAVDEALAEGLLIRFEDGRVIARTRFNALLDAMYDILADYHRQYPLRLGMPREELRSRLKLKQATFGLLLQEQAQVIDEGHLVR